MCSTSWLNLTDTQCKHLTESDDRQVTTASDQSSSSYSLSRDVRVISLTFTAHQRIQFIDMKKLLRQTQTLRTGCSKAEPKIFALLQTPFPGVQDGRNLISWCIDLHQTQFGADWCMQFRVTMLTDQQTQPQTHKQNRLQYTAPLSLACSVTTRLCKMIQDKLEEVTW